MFLIAGNEVVRSRGVGAFKEYIVVGIVGDFQAPRRLDDMTVVFDELQQLPPHSLADTQLCQCPGGAEALLLLLLRSGCFDYLVNLA